MAKFVSDLDINQNQIKNGRFESLASDPSTGNFEGRLFYNSTEKVIKWRTDAGVRKALHAVTSNTTALSSSEANGAITLTIADASGSASGLLSTTNFNLLTGATSANTGNAIVRRDASGDFAARNITAAIVTGLSNPVNNSDAATKGYVDNAVQGLDIKASVKCATTANITLSGAQTIDGVSVGAGERVLVKNQTTAAQNGIYDSASGAWTRSSDAQDGDISPGMFVFVEQGTVNADSGWVLTTDDPMLPIGTQPLAFSQFSGAGQITAGAGLTKTGNTLDVGGTTNRITVNADSIDIASTYVGQTTITTLGTVTSGTWNATTIAANRGGTGQTSYTIGDLLYADSSSTLAKLAGVVTGNALISGGTGTAPSWGKIGLTTHISGTLAVGNGGTGATSFTANGVVLGGTTLSSTAAGTANQVLRIPSAGGAPAFGSINLASSSAVTGLLSLANGGTNATSFTANGVVLGGASALSSTAAGSANQVLRVPGAGGAPAFGAIDLAQSAAVTGLLPLANGGTNASTAAGARTNLDVPRKYKSVVPTTNPATITHNLGTADVMVQIYEIGTGITVYADVTRTSANAVSVGFSVTPSANQYQAIIIAVE